jgi:CheY-like chemotaxis protein
LTVSLDEKDLDENTAAESEQAGPADVNESEPSSTVKFPEEVAESEGNEDALDEEGSDASADLGDEEQQSEEPSAADAGRDFKSVCVLFIEDDEDTAALVSSDIRSLGIENIVRVATAAAAYFQLTEDKDLFPDLIILELVLPGMSGIQLLAKLRADPDLRIRNLPVVVLTEVDSSSVYQRVTNQSISAYLRKPVASGGLQTAITAALSGKIIEPPLAFNRSWIDEAEEEEDSRPEAAGGFSAFTRWIADLFGGKKRRRRSKGARR